MPETKLELKVLRALKNAAKEGDHKMTRHALMYALWPPKDFPKAWRYSSNGGPPGIAMHMGRVLRTLREKGLIHHSFLTDEARLTLKGCGVKT